MRLSSGILLAAGVIFGADRVFGQQGGQTTIGQAGQGIGGQAGQGIKGQANPQGGQNPIGQPGQNPIGQPGQGIKGQPGQPGGQTSVGRPGQQAVGQNQIGQPGQPDGQNPVGQPGQIGVQNQFGQPGQMGVPNQFGQPGITPTGQAGLIPTGQAGLNAQGQSGVARSNALVQSALFMGTQNHFGMPLYQNADVRRSLDLTPAQLNQLNLANTQFSEQIQNQSGRLNSLSSAERAAEIQRLQSTSQQSFWRTANQVYTPEQVQRYRQLELQYQGPGAFSNQDVQSRLNLTNEQIQRLQTLHAQNTQWLQTFQEPGGSGQDAAGRYTTYRQEMNERTNAVLNPQQRQIWQQMTGDPYEFRLPVAPPTDSAYFVKP